MNRFAISHRFEIAVRRHSVPPHSPHRPNAHECVSLPNSFFSSSSLSLSSFDELSCAHFILRFLHVRTLFFCFFHQEITVKTRNWKLLQIKANSIDWFFLNLVPFCDFFFNFSFFCDFKWDFHKIPKVCWIEQKIIWIIVIFPCNWNVFSLVGMCEARSLSLSFYKKKFVNVVISSVYTDWFMHSFFRL